MSEKQQRVDELSLKIDLLTIKSNEFSKEIRVLKGELQRLKDEMQMKPIVHQENIPEKVAPVPVKKVEPTLNETSSSEIKVEQKTVQEKIAQSQQQRRQAAPKPIKKEKTGFERFIGEKLIPKIGILILIIGVGYLAKYSIDNNLINPLTRIVLGYIIGAVVLFFAYRLKKKYTLLSSIMVGGSMAIMYIVTYFAYDFYDLFPQGFAFFLLFIFTAFTVFSAIQYDRQVIAHVGLVGAYAIPFLLSNNSGRFEILFSFILIVNIGILIVAFKKYWKPLLYVSFGVSWVIFSAWFLDDYGTEHLTITSLFLAAFFLLFYVMFLAYKLFRSEKFNVGDIVLIMINSFFFFGFGFNMIDRTMHGGELLGLFTLFNAMLHFIVAFIIYKKQLADKKIFYLIAGMVVIFITLAIPIQIDGHWITIAWIVEAVVLFWLGRTKHIKLYEIFSYPLILIATMSLFMDWDEIYWWKNDHVFILNKTMLTTLIFCAGLVFTFIIDKKNAYQAKSGGNSWAKTLPILLGSLIVLSLYISIFLEIDGLWNHRLDASQISDNVIQRGFFSKDYRFDHLGDIWLINYTLIFAAIGSFVVKKITTRTPVLTSVIIINTLISIIFLMTGLYGISELRDLNTNPEFTEFWGESSQHIVMRYLSILFFVAFLFVNFLIYKSEHLSKVLKPILTLFFHVCLVWLLSSELIHWLDLSGSNKTYKLGLSILWGIYCLVLVFIGFAKNSKLLRISAISFFGLTLLKLFFYDIRHLETLPKIIVFISLGALLLGISFLYNKFKNDLNEEK